MTKPSLKEFIMPLPFNRPHKNDRSGTNQQQPPETPGETGGNWGTISKWLS